MKPIAADPREGEVTPQILQAMESSGCKLFRNNRGLAKYGRFWVKYGVGPNGSGDFLGFLPVRITPEMVGHYVAVFVSAETKRPNGASYDDKQFEWRDFVRAAGGIAGFVHSWEQGRALVMDFYARFQKKTPKVPNGVRGSKSVAENIKNA